MQSLFNSKLLLRWKLLLARNVIISYDRRVLMHGKWNKLTNGERKDLYSTTERDMYIDSDMRMSITAEIQ